MRNLKSLKEINYTFKRSYLFIFQLKNRLAEYSSSRDLSQLKF